MAKKKTYESAIARLEEIELIIGSDDVDLKSCIALYKEAVELSLYCSESLKEYEQEVVELKQQVDGMFILTKLE